MNRGANGLRMTDDHEEVQQWQLKHSLDQHDRISSNSSSNSSATSELTTTTNTTQDDRFEILKHHHKTRTTDHPARFYLDLDERANSGQNRSQLQVKKPLKSSMKTNANWGPEAKAKTITASTILTGGAQGVGDGGGGGDNEDRNQEYRNNNAATSIATTSSSTTSGASDKSTRLLVALFLIGLVVCVTSITCILLLPSLVSNQIAKKLVLKNNSMLLERWSKPNVPMYFKVWLFDIKNAQELIDKRDTKPRVEEIGPFVFNLRRQKDVISFAGENLYYTERKIYHFNRKLSCCAINTTVTIPNIPLVAVVDRALGYNLPLLGRFIPRLINRAIQSLREQLFVRKQVREILFDGYDVELLKMVSRIGSLVGLPQQSQKFALLKGRNDTWRPEQDGVWAINTGQRDRRQFGRVASWNSYKKLPFWPADKCNVINGSDGTLFPPPIKRTEPLYIFNQELCRTVNLVFDGPSDVRSIQAYRFVLNPMNFAHTMTSSSSSPPQQQESGPSLPNAALNRLKAMGGGAQQQANNNGQLLQQPPAQPRLNPMFQNPRPLQPVELLPVRLIPPGSEPLINSNPIGGSQLPPHRAKLEDVPQSPLARAQDVTSQTRTRQQQQLGGGQIVPNGQATGRRTPIVPSGQMETIVPGASERRIIRSEPSAAGPQQSGAIPASDNTVTPLASADADSVSSKQQANGIRDAGVDSKQSAEAAIRSQQEKLIRLAQEAQLANERKSKLNPQTCFCDRKTTNLNGVNVCEFDGLIDLSKCTKQAQVIFGSMPHYYNSDPRLLNQVTGLAPNASKHTTYLDIEPNTGLVLGGKRRVQLNVIIKHNNEIDGFENINDMLVPIVWFEESAQIPEEAAQKFRSMYVDKIRLINLILFSLLTASVALLAVDAKLLITTRRWREFKLMHLGGGSNGPNNERPQKPANNDTKARVSGAQADHKHLRSSGSGSKRHRVSESRQPPNDNGGFQSSRRLDRSLRLAAARPLVVQLKRQAGASSGGANSPLLQSSSSATTASANSSPSVTPPGSPQDSPELRKWSPANGSGGGGGGSVGVRRMLTRIHLGPSSQMAMDKASDDESGPPPPIRIDAANEKSIIELGANGAYHSSGQRQE
uniref:Lysosome membrane protein 2 n=1 Tax=Aceria tosichella TaxID=561515 RepID=A0A6G1SEV4_9ACAR